MALICHNRLVFAFDTTQVFTGYICDSSSFPILSIDTESDGVIQAHQLGCFLTRKEADLALSTWENNPIDDYIK